MRIKWEVDDGYVGGSRPHYVEIPDEDLEDLSEEEQDKYIEEVVQGEFENNIRFYWSKA